jgi:hypothetical protein
MLDEPTDFHECHPEQGCIGYCSWDGEYGAFMWEGDVNGAAQMGWCNCEFHGKCPEPGCALPVHDRAAEFSDHNGYGGTQWSWK